MTVRRVCKCSATEDNHGVVVFGNSDAAKYRRAKSKDSTIVVVVRQVVRDTRQMMLGPRWFIRLSYTDMKWTYVQMRVAAAGNT